jgi:hypothetical protein
MPTLLAVEIMAEAVPSLSLGAVPMIELLFGGSKRPEPKPIMANLSTTSITEELTVRLPSRNRERQIRLIPMEHRKREPIMSESEPLTGATTNLVIGTVVSKRPAYEEE